MKPRTTMTSIRVSVICGVAVLTSGCAHVQRACQSFQPPPLPAPLGALADPIWENQEANAEASDFVVYQHEFDVDRIHLNLGGQDHVRQIAARLQNYPESYVIVEQSNTSVNRDTEFEYRVHPNPALDMRRREVVAKSLEMMGIVDALERVVVAPALAAPADASEAASAHQFGSRNRGLLGTGLGGVGGGLLGGFRGVGLGGGF